LDELPRLSVTEEHRLARRIAHGDPEARDLMVRSNLRLVYTIAHSYLGLGLALEDLIAEGNLGLVRAVEGYDGRAGVRFGSYASHWIKQSIRRALTNQSRGIRLPAHVVKLLAKWRKASALLADRLGRAPETHEVARALRLSAKKTRFVVDALRINAATHQADDTAETPIEADFPDPRTKGPDTEVAEADTLARVFERLKSLEEREATVIRLRFGLDGHSPMTLSAIGQRIGLTRERIRQLEVQALARLSGVPE
jgi:RNA polymerase primary sigma factor